MLIVNDPGLLIVEVLPAVGLGALAKEFKLVEMPAVARIDFAIKSLLEVFIKHFYLRITICDTPILIKRLLPNTLDYCSV